MRCSTAEWSLKAISSGEDGYLALVRGLDRSSLTEIS
jgi:hypothetical protein